MNSTICNFLSGNIIEQISSLFNESFEDSKPGAAYPLIYSLEHPQFYFLNAPLENLSARPGYKIVGLFTLEEINDPDLLQKKINELKEKWCKNQIKE